MILTKQQYDDRPRKAIEAAKDYLNKPNKQNQAAANEAANAANAKVKTKTINYGLKLLGNEYGKRNN